MADRSSAMTDPVEELRLEVAQLRTEIADLRAGQVEVLVTSINTGNADVLNAIRRRIRMNSGSTTSLRLSEMF
jgi:hypothetical protein